MENDKVGEHGCDSCGHIQTFNCWVCSACQSEHQHGVYRCCVCNARRVKGDNYTVMGPIEARDVAHTIGLKDPEWSYTPARIASGRYCVVVRDIDGEIIGRL